MNRPFPEPPGTPPSRGPHSDQSITAGTSRNRDRFLPSRVSDTIGDVRTLTEPQNATDLDFGVHRIDPERAGLVKRRSRWWAWRGSNRGTSPCRGTPALGPFAGIADAEERLHQRIAG